MECNIGEALRSFREYKNLTIEELATGICTEEKLRAYEKDRDYPTIDVLYKIAERLQIDILYFFETANKSAINYTTAVMQIIDKYKRERNYHAIDNIVQREKKNPMFKETTLKQYLLWHEGICIYYLHNDLFQAIKLLDEAIAITNPTKQNLTERETEILNSIALLHYDNNDYTSALPIFLEALTNLDKLPHIINPKIKIRVLFGLSQVFTELNHFEESLNYCHKGINLCINQESLYCLNEFHYQMGENYVKLGEVEKGRYYLNECLHLLKLERKTRLLEIMDEEIKNLLSIPNNNEN